MVSHPQIQPRKVPHSEGKRNASGLSHSLRLELARERKTTISLSTQDVMARQAPAVAASPLPMRLLLVLLLAASALAPAAAQTTIPVYASITLGGTTATLTWSGDPASAPSDWAVTCSLATNASGA